MKKTLFTALRAMCVGAMTLAAVSCYDDSALRGEIDGLGTEVDGLAARLDELESRLNDNVKAVNALTASMTELETSVKKVLETAGTEDVKAALEKKIAELETKLTEAIAKGDQASADALAKQKAELQEAMTELQDGFNSSIAASEKKLNAAIATLEAAMGEELESLLAKMDQADGKLDGKITDLAAAVEQVKKDYAAADTQLGNKLSADLVAEIAKVVAKIAVVDVEVQADKVVLTLATGETVEIAKPLAEQQPETEAPETETPATPEVSLDGLVTIINGENGVKFWAVIVNGEPESLGVQVGSDVNLEFKVEEGQLMYTTNGENWLPTGAYTNEGKLDFFQGETGDYEWSDEVSEMVPVLQDFYTFVFAGQEYYLPMYRVDNSVVLLKSGKTYFTYGEEKVIDVVLTDVTSTYVMNKPEGWRASLSGTKLTVVAPAEAMVTGGYAEAAGEVLLHCTTVEGGCKVARLGVATTAGFSLSVDKEGNLKIVNPEVVTTMRNMGWETVEVTDFNDAIIGLATVAAFEADPLAYVQNIDNNDDQWYYLSNWKMNTADYDEEQEGLVYSVGGAYQPGAYEVDVIETTVPQMYADWTYGDEIPATPFVVWACPMDEGGMPRINDLVYTYYYPSVKATVTEVNASQTDVELKVAVTGATTYYVGFAADEMLYGFPIDTYMQMQEGPFGYFQMALQYGMADYAFQQMGTPFGGEFGEEMPETITASMLNYGMPMMPNTHFYVWVFPVVDGLELADYTYEANLKPYIYEFTTKGLEPGSDVTVDMPETCTADFSSISVELAATDASMIYYRWFTPDAFDAKELAELTADVLAAPFVINGNAGEARTNADNELEVGAGTELYLVALAVDTEGKYGEIAAASYTSKTLEYSETFKATFGEFEGSVYYSGYRYNFPITVEGGEAAKYYYVWSETEYTDVQLANLPLSYNYDYNFKSTTNVAAGQLAGQYANASSTYYLAVVVESTNGEFSPVIKMTVEVPAVPAEGDATEGE